MNRSPEHWVLLHGTPLSPAVWDGFAAALGPDAQVTRPDLRRLPADGHPAPLQTGLARTVVADLPDQPVHLAGHSFGGQVALELALIAPERVATLTLLCTRDSPFPPFAGTAAALRTGTLVDSQVTLARWFRPDELAADGPVVRYARRCVDDADPVTWAATLEAIATYDRTDQVRVLQLPVAVIAAADDHVSTPEAMAGMAARIPGAVFHSLAGAAHMSPFVDPAALAALVTGAIIDRTG